MISKDRHHVLSEQGLLRMRIRSDEDVDILMPSEKGFFANVS